MANAEPNILEISRRLRELLDGWGLTQAAFAEKVGVPASTLSETLRGRYLPSVEMLFRLRFEFGVSLDWLLAGEGEAMAGPYGSAHAPPPTGVRLAEFRYEPQLQAGGPLVAADPSADQAAAWPKPIRVRPQFVTEQEHAELLALSDASPAKRLREFLHAHNVTKAQVGRELGLAGSYIQAVAKGDRRPSQRVLEGLRKLYGVNPDWILKGAPPVWLSPEPDSLNKRLSDLEGVVARVVQALQRAPQPEEAPKLAHPLAQQLDRALAADDAEAKRVAAVVEAVLAPTRTRG